MLIFIAITVILPSLSWLEFDDGERNRLYTTWEITSLMALMAGVREVKGALIPRKEWWTECHYNQYVFIARYIVRRDAGCCWMSEWMSRLIINSNVVSFLLRCWPSFFFLCWIRFSLLFFYHPRANKKFQPHKQTFGAPHSRCEWESKRKKKKLYV